MMQKNDIGRIFAQTGLLCAPFTHNRKPDLAPATPLDRIDLPSNSVARIALRNAHFMLQEKHNVPSTVNLARDLSARYE
jgi:hypothetical protein